MNNITIKEAILSVLKEQGQPLELNEVYQLIKEKKLYLFNSESPIQMVRITMRKHCDNLDFPSASKQKFFTLTTDGKYWIKDEKRYKKEIIKKPKLDFIKDLRKTHTNYTQNFKKDILQQLVKLTPKAFENFSKLLLQQYGFRNLHVTRTTRDGGIDGYGELKIGLVYMKVAFECKKWKSTTVGRPKISQFRGDIQGKYQQGIYFTTSKYTKEAKQSSLQTGAVPIILVDGTTIVDMMIKKQFGIEVEELPIYTNALDLIISNI